MVTREDILRHRRDGTLRYYRNVMQERPGYTTGYAGCDMCDNETTASYGWDEPDNRTIDICPHCFWTTVKGRIPDFSMSHEAGGDEILFETPRMIVCGPDDSKVKCCFELCGSLNISFFDALYFINLVRNAGYTPQSSYSWDTILRSRRDPRDFFDMAARQRRDLMFGNDGDY